MHIVGLLLGLLPASRWKNRLMSLLVRGWTVAPGAAVGPCLFWRVLELSVADGASIGSGNAFRAMRRVSLGEGAEIGQLNWFSAAAHYTTYLDPDRAGALDMAGRSGIASRHYFDCSGGLSIDELSIFAGVRSTVVTHGVEPKESVVVVRPVHIGERCLISTGVTITMGVTVAPRCIVGAGAVLAKDLTEPESLYAGVPARAIRSLSGFGVFDRPNLGFRAPGSGRRAGDDAPDDVVG